MLIKLPNIFNIKKCESSLGVKSTVIQSVNLFVFSDFEIDFLAQSLLYQSLWRTVRTNRTLSQRTPSTMIYRIRVRLG